MSRPAKEDTVSEMEKVSKILSASQSGDVDLFWAAAMQLSGGDGEAPHLTEERGRTALHFAAQAGHLQLCTYMIENLKFNVNAQDNRGDTALSLAAAAGQEETVGLLLQHGADPALYAAGKAGPLHRAAGAGSSGAVSRLLGAGADANAPSENGAPLLWAAGSGHADVIRLLLRAGADPNLAAQQGMTPLAMAVAVECVEGVRLLVSGGANVNAAVPGGFTALHIAAESGKESLVQLLLEAGADPLIKDDQGKNPLRAAGEVGHKGVVAQLARSALEVVEAGLDEEGSEVGTSGAAGRSSSGRSSGMDTSGGTSEAGEGTEPGGSGVVSGEDDEKHGDAREGDSSGAAAAATGRQAAVQMLSELPAAGGADGGEGNEGVAEMFREKANEFFEAGDYQGAIQLYTLALQHCSRSPVLWGNRAAAYLKLGHEEQALQDARSARTVEPAYTKGWYREGAAAAALGRWAEAVAAYEGLSRLRPGCPQVTALLEEAKGKLAAGKP